MALEENYQRSSAGIVKHNSLEITDLEGLE